MIHFDIGAGTGEFSALDVNTGEILWNKQLNSIAIGGATVINDLVFTSTLDGKIYAFDKTTGSIIWESQAPGGINGWPAVSEDFIVIPVGLGPKPQLIALQLGKAGSTPGDGESVPLTETPRDRFRIGFGRANLAAGLNAMQAWLSGAKQ